MEHSVFGGTWALHEIWREQERYHMPGLYPHDCKIDDYCRANVEWFFRRWLIKKHVDVNNYDL